MTIAKLLNPDAIPFLPALDSAVVESIDAPSLLTPRRFDLAAKVIYACAVRDGCGLDWARRVYEEHLRIFNGFVEGDVSGKNCLLDYESAFLEMIDGFMMHGFDGAQSVIPVGQDLVLFDGAHRAGAAIAAGCPISIARFDARARSYDSMYFKRRGLSVEAMDAMAIEYCRQKESCYLALEFSAGTLRKTARNIEEVVYQKTIPLNEAGASSLMRHLASLDEWSRDGTSQSYKVTSEAEGRVPFRKGTVTACLLDVPASRDVSRIMDNVRAVSRGECVIIPIGQPCGDAFRFAQILFHRNSLWALNTMDPLSAQAFRKRLDSSPGKEAGSRCCLGLDSLLEVMCARAAQKIYWCEEEQVYSDPARYFYFDGVKIIMPQAALEFFSGMDEKKRGLLESLVSHGVDDTKSERKRRRRQAFYYGLLRARRTLRVDQAYRAAMSVRRRLTRR